MQIGGILPTCSKLIAWQIKGVDGNTLTGFNFQILNFKKNRKLLCKEKQTTFLFSPENTNSPNTYMAK